MLMKMTEMIKMPMRMKEMNKTTLVTIKMMRMKTLAMILTVMTNGKLMTLMKTLVMIKMMLTSGQVTFLD